MDQTVLVHLSDIHFTGRDDGAADRNRSLRIDLVNDLRRMRPVVGDAMALLVTGDIAFSAAEAEYVEAQEWLERVAAEVGTDPAQILTVPGNHDVDRSAVGRSAELAHQRLRECDDDDLDRELEKFLTDPGRPLLGPLDNYNKFAAQYGCDVPKSGRAWELPIDLGGGYTLAVRGLSSVFSSDADDNRQTLLLGKTQTTLPAEPGTVYLLLAHHGPDDCRDETSIRDRIKDRAAALLTGHRHAQRVRQVEQCIELTAGAVNPEELTGWHPSYNWLRLHVEHEGETPDLVLEIWNRIWKAEWNGFGSGHREGESEVRRVEIGLPLAPAPCPSRATTTPVAPASAPSEPVAATLPPRRDTRAESASDMSGASDSDGAAEQRPPLEDTDGEVDQERRVRHALFQLDPPQVFNALTECGVLDAKEWTKDYLTMISDAIATARDRNLLGDLEAAVAAETEGR